MTYHLPFIVITGNDNIRSKMSSPNSNFSELGSFKLRTDLVKVDERMNISYRRARVVAKAYGMLTICAISSCC